MNIQYCLSVIVLSLFMQATVDQRGRLLMSTDRVNQSSERIMESRRTILETEEIGVSILEDLHQQRQSLLNAHNTVGSYYHIVFSPSHCFAMN